MWRVGGAEVCCGAITSLFILTAEMSNVYPVAMATLLVSSVLFGFLPPVSPAEFRLLLLLQ